MNYQYSNEYNPPAPVLPITIHIPYDSTKHMAIEALLDTGADITCFPIALINALDAECAGGYDVLGVNNIQLGHFDTYFLEFEIETVSKIVEVIGLGNEPILGRNFINEFKILFNGPSKIIDITLTSDSL